MRDGEGLVQVEVAHVTADAGELSPSDEGIKVCSVDVDLSACLVDHVADLSHAVFIDAVS